MVDEDAAAPDRPARRLLPSAAISGCGRGAAVLRRVAVVAGGPGTGKTTTVARILALLAEQAGAAGRPAARRARRADGQGGRAARGGRARRGRRGSTSASDVREQLLGARGVDVHRLLGWRAAPAASATSAATGCRTTS